LGSFDWAVFDGCSAGGVSFDPQPWTMRAARPIMTMRTPWQSLHLSGPSTHAMQTRNPTIQVDFSAMPAYRIG
jgi:hypothetical protein